MEETFVATVSTVVEADAGAVWDALVNPNTIRRYMFGTEVASGWIEGSPIVWRGEWQGKRYEDRGVILRLQPRRTLQYSHYSPLSGAPDVPEHHHTVTIDLREDGAQTFVTLTQDNNRSEQARAHSEKNWQAVLDGLKRVVEERGAGAGTTA